MRVRERRSRGPSGEQSERVARAHTNANVLPKREQYNCPTLYNLWWGAYPSPLIRRAHLKRYVCE